MEFYLKAILGITCQSSPLKQDYSLSDKLSPLHSISPISCEFGKVNYVKWGHGNLFHLLPMPHSAFHQSKPDRLS